MLQIFYAVTKIYTLDLYTMRHSLQCAPIEAGGEAVPVINYLI